MRSLSLLHAGQRLLESVVIRLRVVAPMSNHQMSNLWESTSETSPESRDP
jgi:hypothetical protein